MKYLPTITASFFFTISMYSTADTAPQCQVPAKVYGASYEITRTDEAAKKSHSQTENLTLLRNESKALHIREHAEYSELWELNSLEQVHYTHFYDHKQRAIEYYQSERSTPASSKGWSQASQIIPEQVLKSHSFSTDQGKDGCESIARYQYQEGGINYQLDWLPQQRLILSLTMTQGAKSTQWKLLAFIDSPQVLKDELALRARYTTIDYADLGDQESDPFFMSLKLDGHQHATAHGHH